MPAPQTHPTQAPAADCCQPPAPARLQPKSYQPVHDLPDRWLQGQRPFKS